jgi:hypothetical protein
VTEAWAWGGPEVARWAEGPAPVVMVAGRPQEKERREFAEVQTSCWIRDATGSGCMDFGGETHTEVTKVFFEISGSGVGLRVVAISRPTEPN